MITLTVHEAARHFLDLVHRVTSRGESASLSESGRVVVELLPASRRITGAALAAAWIDCPHLDDEADGFERDVFAARANIPAVGSKWD